MKIYIDPVSQKLHSNGLWLDRSDLIMLSRIGYKIRQVKPGIIKVSK